MSELYRAGAMEKSSYCMPAHMPSWCAHPIYSSSTATNNINPPRPNGRRDNKPHPIRPPVMGGKDAVEFAKGKPIDLVDGPALMTLVGALQRGETAPQDLACPVCHGSMVKRHARELGKMFYGCLDYPKCKGTRPIL